MAVCPHCHQMDKNFFAPRCHNCNQPVDMGEQFVHSTIWTVVPPLTVAFVVGILWLIFS
jgi:hypothetical protein